MRETGKVLSLTTRGLFLPVCLILALQASGARLLSMPEGDFPIPNLRQLPLALENWKAPSEQALEADVTAYLKPDDYILRNYVDTTAGSSISLFVAYFKSLQNVYGPHSPRVCLPGSGWLVRSSALPSIHVPGRTDPIPVNEYFLEKSDDRILVIYWYQNNRNIWAEEFRAKLTLLPDLIRYRRSDASLVRVITPVSSADGGKEREQALQFTRSMFPLLVERFKATD